MTARLLDGKALAAQIRSEIADQVQQFTQSTGTTPVLAAVLVGEDPASEVYVRYKQKDCEKVGMGSQLHRLPDTASQDELLALLDKLNSDPLRARHPGAAPGAQADRPGGGRPGDQPRKGRRLSPPGERGFAGEGAAAVPALHAQRGWWSC